jgi:hypothetical protein
MGPFCNDVYRAAADLSDLLSVAYTSAFITPRMFSPV